MNSGAQTTIVVPVWDDYVVPLTAALESVRAQMVDIAVVVVDNASAVALPELADAQIVRSPTRATLGAARNLGLAHVATPYFVMWDADDLMLPGTLAHLENGFESLPGIAVFATAIVEAASGPRHRWPRRWIGPVAAFEGAFALLDCVWSVYPTTGATIMRTDFARAAGGYGDADSGDDWVLGVSLAFRGRITWSERPGRIYQRHERSIWSRHSTAGHLLSHAHAVRRRIRADRGIPGWARLALPIILCGQCLAILAHVAIDAARHEASLPAGIPD